jgi:hypothetical protein
MAMKAPQTFFGWTMKTPRFIRRIKYAIKFFFQRLFRGWDDSETWALDGSLAQIIAPRLKRFKQVNNCHPDEFTEEEWDATIDKMIFAFEWASSEKKYNWIDTEEFKRVEEGIALFAKYYFHLWW